MKKNKLVIVITLILALFATYFIFKTTSGTLSKKLSDFAVTDTSSITKIFLSDKANNSVVLEKNMPGDWKVNGKYKATNDGISVLLKTIMRLEVKEPVAKAARNNVIKRIAAIAIKVEVYQNVYRIDIFGIKLFQHEKLVKTYYVGDATQNMKGTYMLMEGADEPFIMHIPGFNGFLSSRYSSFEKDWRDHSMFNFALGDIKSVKLEFPAEPEKSYKIDAIEKGKYKLTSLYKNQLITDYDTVRLLDYLLGFEGINYEFLISDNKTHKKDSIIASTPFHILTISDYNGETTTIKTFHKAPNEGETEIDGTPTRYDKDRLYAQFSNGKDFGLIQFYVFDKILRPVAYFLKDAGSTPKNPNK
jgi:hypothetical protein